MEDILNSTLKFAALRSQEEITKRWRQRVDAKPLVSICCVAYNQDAFIENALCGFLSQETDFAFEILIHDDASTDRTAEIIRRFANSYPDLVFPIYQSENQYSKGIRINSKFNFPRARGEFIALCEGDDYWVNPRKLDLQVRTMLLHSGCNLSFHPAIEKDMVSGEERIVCNHGNVVRLFDIDEVLWGGGGFMPTASLVIAKGALAWINKFFEEHRSVRVGDKVCQIIGSCFGGALYIPLPMSVYRWKVPGSWSEYQTGVKNRAISAARVRSYLETFLLEYRLLAFASEHRIVTSRFHIYFHSILRWIYRFVRVREIKAGLAIFVSYAILFYTPLLWFAGDLLVMRNAPKAADAILVFSGDGEPWYASNSDRRRAMDVLSLYRAGYAQRIVLSAGKGQAASETEVVRTLLISQGVPADAITLVAGLPKTTRDNVGMSAEQLRLLEARTVLFVTAPYHSLRADKVWRKEAPDISISTVSVIDTPSSRPKWQMSSAGAKVIAYEYLAMAYYWWKGWI